MSKEIDAKSRLLMAGIIFWGLVVHTIVKPVWVQADPDAPTALQIIEPNGEQDTLPELDEFATMQIGDPWDMKNSMDLQLYHTVDSYWENEYFADGFFHGTLTRGDGTEYLMPLYAGGYMHDAMRIGRIGYNYPINADYYRYLVFRMYYDGPSCYTGIVHWSEDDSRAPATSGISNVFFVPPKPACEEKPPGWYIYTLDLQSIGVQWGQKDWGGIVRELRIIPVGNVSPGINVRIDWIRLTHEDPTTARPFTIRWRGGSGDLQLYASREDTVLDADDIFIGTVNASAGQYQWQTGVMEAGTYYIYATNGTDAAWSPGPVVFKAPPTAHIASPSMTSGPEYSAVEIGNPWDMNDSADVNLAPPPPFNICMDQVSFTDGVFHARTPLCPGGLYGNDPMIFLGGMDRYPAGTPDPEVDTSRYHYLSFRYYLEGEQDLAKGWVARFVWWKENATDNGAVELPSLGRDIILYEGWHTYTLDLMADDAIDEISTNGIPWAQAHPNRLRLDPNELFAELSPGYIHLDWVKLTAMDSVVQGDLYPITFTASDDDVSYQVFYDTDRIASNGRMPVQIYTPDVTPHGQFKVFLPALFKTYTGPGGDGEPFDGYRVWWDTSDVPPGQYWIGVVLNNGYNETTWYSDAPIEVQP
jgi:hypothetical protein